MTGTSALQSGLLRRICEEVATLIGQPAVCMFFDMEWFYDSVCLHKLIDQSLERNFPKRLLDNAMHAYLSERVLRAGEMVVQSTQPPQWHTGWLLLGKQVCASGISEQRIRRTSSCAS